MVLRTSLAYLTVSAWTVDAVGENMLLCYRNIYDSRSWVGGHPDGELNLAAVDAREPDGAIGAPPVSLAYGLVLVALRA